jgi:hypothetical protein
VEIHLISAFWNNQCRCHNQSVELESWKCPAAAEGPFKWHWGFQAWILHFPMMTGAGGHGTAASASFYAVSWIRSRDCVKRSRRGSGLKVHLVVRLLAPGIRYRLGPVPQSGKMWVRNEVPFDCLPLVCSSLGFLPLLDSLGTWQQFSCAGLQLSEFGRCRK